MWVSLMRMVMFLRWLDSLEWNLAVRLCSCPSPPLDSWSTATPCQDQAPSPQLRSPSSRHPNFARGAGTPIQGRDRSGRTAASGDRLPQPTIEKHGPVSVQKGWHVSTRSPGRSLIGASEKFVRNASRSR
jgi:hypothetical protein